MYIMCYEIDGSITLLMIDRQMIVSKKAESASLCQP